MHTRWHTTDGLEPSTQPSNAPESEQPAPNPEADGYTADLTAGPARERTPNDRTSRLRELAAGTCTDVPQPFDMTRFKAQAKSAENVDDWRPAITPLNDCDQVQPSEGKYESDRESGDGRAKGQFTQKYQSYGAAPSALPPTSPSQHEVSEVGSDDDQSAGHHSAPTWVRRGGKAAVASAFLNRAESTDTELPSAPTGSDHSDVDDPTTSIAQAAVVTAQVPEGATTPALEAFPAASNNDPSAVPLAPPPVQRRSDKTAPAERTSSVPAPTRTKKRRAKPGLKVVPAPKPETAPKPSKPKPAPAASAAPALVTPPAPSSADVFAADLQVRVSKIVAEDAAVKSKQALSAARNSSADADAKANAAKAKGDSQADTEVVAAIAHAHKAAATAQAAHYDAETKIRALEIARTALAALTRAPAQTILPANPTEVDLAIAAARTAIANSTHAAEVARSAALDANLKAQAARKAPSDEQLSIAATKALSLAGKKQRSAYTAELEAEAAVARARRLTS